MQIMILLLKCEIDNGAEYRGETALHIAIVNRDFESVKWIVQQRPELLSIVATGSFFEFGKPCYYGYEFVAHRMHCLLLL